MDLKPRVQTLYQRIESCDLCPHACGVNRLEHERGLCNNKDAAIVGSFGCHYGEESPLVGQRGSGTIFFSNCNVRCVFCQNWDIAHQGIGHHVTDQELANMMLRLQDKGAHNINLVTPTHVVHNIINAIDIAKEKGLNIPICYNTSGYESKQTLELLEGIIDIYLVDMKFAEGTHARRYTETNAHDYPSIVKEAVKTMQRQVGRLKTTNQGIAQKGLMIRHLILPNNVSGTNDIIQWISQNLPLDTYVNLMAQYRPCYKAKKYPDISRPIDKGTFVDAVSYALALGLTNVDSDTLSQYAMHTRH